MKGFSSPYGVFGVFRTIGIRFPGFFCVDEGTSFFFLLAGFHELVSNSPERGSGFPVFSEKLKLFLRPGQEAVGHTGTVAL